VREQAIGRRCSWSLATERYLLVLKMQVEIVGYLLLLRLLLLLLLVVVVVVVVYEPGGRLVKRRSG